MTIASRLVWSTVIAALFAVTLLAQERCPPVPENYRGLEFGAARYAIEEGCRTAFTQNEQFFVAGVAQALSSDCKLPRDRAGRALVQRLLDASKLALALRKTGDPLRDTVTTEMDQATAFAAGTSMMEDIRCNGPEAKLLSRGIVLYLQRTAQRSRFLGGCMERYAGRYGEKECRCIANTLRSVFPDVDERFFDRELIKRGIHDSPTIAFPLMFTCGVKDY